MRQPDEAAALDPAQEAAAASGVKAMISFGRPFLDYVLSALADAGLEAIREKPDAGTLARLGPEAPVSMNCWRFSSAIFGACRRVPLSPRGELELPMAVNTAIAEGVRFKVVRCREGVLDLSRRGDIA